MSAMNNSWSIESVRITAFLENVGDVPDGGFFEHCLQVTPERSEQRRAEGLSIDTAVVNQVQYTLSAQRGRFDWLISSGVDPTAQSLGGLENLPGLLADVGPGLSEGGVIKRLAFGVVARIKAEDKIESYKILQTYLHKLEVDPENSSELSYKINRPRVVRIGDEAIVVNRLSTWQAVLMQQYRQIINAGGGAGAPPELVEAANWVRCELDINTDANREVPFERELIPVIFNALTDFSLEILDQGDIA